jgi:hypothetical protein
MALAKLIQGRPSVSGPFPLDQIIPVIVMQEAGPRERWPKVFKGELENNSRNPRDLVRKLA